MRSHGVTVRESGAHGVVYTSGVATGGCVVAYEALQGRHIRTICGSRGQFVAVVDAWDLDWQPSRDRSQVLEHETVALGLKGDVKIQQVAFGEHHRVAVTLDGHLYSWGTRGATFTTGELGHVASSWHPVTLTPRRAAATSEKEKGGPDRDHHAAAATETPDDDNQFDDRADASGRHAGTGICWPRRVHTPQQLFFVKVACGAHHSVALTDKGDLYAWGRNIHGQLGLGFLSNTLSTNQHNSMSAWPKYVGALLGKPPVVDVACGDAFTVALLADGTVWRWGERVAGTTGRSPDEKMDAQPRRLVISSPSTEDVVPVFSGIAAGSAHALGVTTSGALYAWGLNVYGQLGLGPDRRASSDAACRVPTTTITITTTTETRWAKVVAGSHYSAALASDGQLFTWGHNHYGTLGHAPTPQCEFAPRAVAALRGVSVTSVVCGQKHLFAFAPTVVTSITPTSGEISGGYELRIRGSGFWDSEDLTVRFVPLTEGRLPRGAIATFDFETREIVCLVPTFSLPGDFTVEVATNGKHFTTDGHVFAAFKRPPVVSVSRWEARLTGGDAIEITVDSTIPRSCSQPLLGLVIPTGRIHVSGSVVVAVSPRLILSPCEDDDGVTTAKPVVSTTTLLRFVLPPLEDTTSVVRCPLELSFNGGNVFAPVYLEITTGPKTPFSLHLHAAAVIRCRPNSFQARALPTTIQLDVRHLLTPTSDWNELSVALRVAPLNVSDATTESRVDVVLVVDHVERSATNDTAVVTCTVPSMNEWKLSKLDAKTGDRVVIVTDWWKFVPRWGFKACLQVSMNGGQSLLPSEGSSAVYGLFTTGKILTASPLATPLSGGTLVSVAADYFHFDTEDAVVALRWKDQREVRVAAKSSNTNCSTTTVQPLSRRLIFTTAALPFPPPPTPPSAPSIEDDESTPPLVEEPLATDDMVGLSEDVEVFVSLDGHHFQRESSLRLTYVRSPELLEISPSDAPPATRMTLKVDKAPPPSAALTSACVRLTTATLGLSTIVSVEVNEPANAFEFVLPVLPIAEQDTVRVAFSLDGQQFDGERVAAADGASESERDLSFRYRAPAPIISE